MPSNTQWVFDPDSGGVKIPETVKQDVKRRINDVAEKHFKGKYTKLDIHFRRQFCYIDLFCEIETSRAPDDWQGTQEEYLKHLHNTPFHLCRLRYFGREKWGFSLFGYSNGKYELSVYPDGEFFGKPEDAFMASAEDYLL